jgi:hypothetical protein
MTDLYFEFRAPKYTALGGVYDHKKVDTESHEEVILDREEGPVCSQGRQEGVREEVHEVRRLEEGRAGVVEGFGTFWVEQRRFVKALVRQRVTSGSTRGTDAPLR